MRMRLFRRARAWFRACDCDRFACDVMSWLYDITTSPLEIVVEELARVEELLADLDGLDYWETCGDLREWFHQGMFR